MQQDLGKFRWRAAEEGNRRRKSQRKEKGGATSSGSTKAPDQGEGNGGRAADR
ncbi:uncharacterized protein H6S33_001598 [Morchella sextelata]|uniref:uncharacterized protein n=1 Tax=Morchella sextelata TaxID=1174677 RepID=UPI001D05A78B|nr:uncharacterized protein H6S33_001598 [Morchella sextelata]KAH0608464.1 hypothetical protein H6S33_001598 [Morchella sextelata]